MEGVGRGHRALASSGAGTYTGLRLLEEVQAGTGASRRGLSHPIPPASSPLGFPSCGCSRKLDGQSGGQSSTLDTRWLRGSMRLTEQSVENWLSLCSQLVGSTVRSLCLLTARQPWWQSGGSGHRTRGMAQLKGWPCSNQSPSTARINWGQRPKEVTS